MTAAPKLSPTQGPPTLRLVQTARPTDLPPAGNGKRLLASVVDCFLSLMAAKLAAGLIVGSITTPTETNTWAITSAFNLLYWVGLPLLMDATPGKKIMGLRVVRDNYDPDLSMGQLFLRETLGKFFSVMLMLAGLVMILFDIERRSLHDRLCKTRVVDVRPSPNS